MLEIQHKIIPEAIKLNGLYLAQPIEMQRYCCKYTHPAPSIQPLGYLWSINEGGDYFAFRRNGVRVEINKRPERTIVAPRLVAEVKVDLGDEALYPNLPESYIIQGIGLTGIRVHPDAKLYVHAPKLRDSEGFGKVTYARFLYASRIATFVHNQLRTYTPPHKALKV